MECHKPGHPTKREAKAMHARTKAARGTGDGHRKKRGIYWCRCGLYHLTSQPHRRFDAEEVA